MTSEEIKALGLRVGDVRRITKDYTIEHVDGDGLAVICVNHGGFPAKDIVAIERVVPDGWIWINAPATVYMMWNKEMNLRASISADGLIDCWSMEPGNYNAHYKTPALVAKALIEVWEQGQ